MTAGAADGAAGAAADDSVFETPHSTSVGIGGILKPDGRRRSGEVRLLRTAAALLATLLESDFFSFGAAVAGAAAESAIEGGWLHDP